MVKIQGKYSKQLSHLLESSDNIVLISHYNPDGDAIGSMLGLNRYLETKGKKSEMISPNGIQDFLMWMKNVDSIIIGDEEPGRAVSCINKADLIIMLDFNHIDRSGKLMMHVDSSVTPKVLIDHHPEPTVKADLLISEPGYSSTAELVFDIIRSMEGDYYTDPEFIEDIFTGMATDTGNFSFGTFDGDTFRTVAVMLDNGLDKDRILELIYDNFSINRLKLQAYAIYERMVYIEQYGCAYIYLTKSDLDRFKYKSGDTEGFVNIPLSIKNVVLTALFIEKDTHIKISLRSRGEVNARDLAVKYFNGGGHKNASGGKYKGTLKECLEYFENLLCGI